MERLDGHSLERDGKRSMPAAPATAVAAAGFSVRRRRHTHLHRGGDLLLDGHVAYRTRRRRAWLHALFVIDRIAAEFGEAGSLPVILAAWAPALSGLLLALGLLLHLEDG